MTVLGFVGHEAAKFTPVTEEKARRQMRDIMSLKYESVSKVVSGKCHLGGIDIWAIEEAQALGIPTQEFEPINRSWSAPGGFMERNIAIAKASDVVYSIVVRTLPETYKGMTFGLCYHCGTKSHVKSGGCWTAKFARRLGKPGLIIEI
jgi:hypothetical protein